MKKQTKNSDSKTWNVWIEGDPKHDYFKGRTKIEAVCGDSSGSGSGFGGWDTSYHQRTKDEAEEIAKKAKKLSCTDSVRLYEDSDDPAYGGTMIKKKKA